MADSEFIRTIEINGVKLEIDLRQARVAQIDTLKVGSKVKLLEPATDYSASKVHSGVVVGFCNFREMPTIEVAYLDVNYGSSELKFCMINGDPKTKSHWSIVGSNDDDFGLSKAQVVQDFEAKITTKKREAADLEAKRDFFLRKFDAYFAQVVDTPTAAE